ncbi:undecaprenyl-diphosphate phosphatase [Planktothrix sp. FACHB-1355]|uniref:Undecaprenyl-diphosphatase n=1 Tax=Aerosakkonema funiforme FACHB-1375 TaxID=2949571 RepID=A0A926VH52_9CYAN|nr:MULTISPECIES: undecaprenyl-diphosphate phosphatase [Oscillatoriales]MBD2183643.1 undecaprenyl-diphosphate phosphatase [Aerosakkonema funiforme FACHB-1375]MBD3560748.1 undecaprenyl-diphosphate phosphatase [Planktothrix sp. FACHB-1355]
MGLSKHQLFTFAGTSSASALLALFLNALGTHLSAAATLEEAATPPAAQVNIIQAIVLGMVQGLTEFLPISSTAHLKVVPVVLGWGDPGVAFTAVIQLGSIAAVLWYFWRDLTNITIGAIEAIVTKDYDSQDFQIGLGIILGTIPIVFFGLLIKILIPDFDNSPMRSLAVIATASIVMSVLLGIAEKLGTRKRKFNALGVKDGILMGLAEAMALVPGVSRSGSTLTAGLFMGLERGTAARFSFLLGIPAITLAGLVELKDVVKQGLGDAGLISVIVGVISAAIFSYLAIAWLLRFLQTQSTWVFIWYRLLFGVAILGAIGTGLLQNS